jgi:hypothetical protein
MSVAEIEGVDPDPERAREFLAQAKTFLADAANSGLSLARALSFFSGTRA